MSTGAFAAHPRASGNSPDERAPQSGSVLLGDVTLLADCAGALYWPDEQLLLVADLHLEKGSAFAARGVLLPPYDTAATLARLARLVERYAPRLVVALGDNFHDDRGPLRMSAADRAALKLLQRGRDWIWIAGNHDPNLPDGIGGGHADLLALGPLTFRHRAVRTALRWRNRRSFASRCARGAARTGNEPTLFCQRRTPPRHAGIWRLCRRPQRARPRDLGFVRDAFIHRAHARRAAPVRHRCRAMLAGLAARRCTRINPAETPRWRSSRSSAPSARSQNRRASRDRARH